MDNSIYTALSRQVAVFRDLDVTANNIANANTAGYNAQDLLQTQFTVSMGNRQPLTMENPVRTYRRLDPGPMTVTGNPLDVAITGSGYFTVETPLGNRYTRAGNFQLDAEGTLVNANGYPVLDSSNQRIVFDPEDQQITVGSYGNISVDGEERATLGVVTFDNQQAMESVGGNLYRADASPIANPQDGTIIVTQGTIEGSNVQPIKQMIHLVELQRSVGMTTQMINALYDLQQRTSRTLTQSS